MKLQLDGSGPFVVLLQFYFSNHEEFDLSHDAKIAFFRVFVKMCKTFHDFILFWNFYKL